MFDRIRRQVLRFARVPADPEPPQGAPGSVRIFRAGRNLYHLRLLGWAAGQAGAVAGICFSLWFLHGLDETATALRSPAPAAVTSPASGADSAAPATPRAPNRRERAREEPARRSLVRTVAGWPPWTLTALHWLEYGAILLFLLQIPVTFAAVRLEYELHWYIVTDRSLRIRTGLFRLQESTMSFANLQQVEVKQGPLQRLLGLADVRVQSAGGGGERPEAQGGDSLHTGIFHGVDNAGEIRDLILERLRLFRAAGLGDPDDPEPAAGSPPPSDALAAARELLAEARALRQVLAR
ncbi:MAG: PH domain-containing protein [Opitutaceae bacterium]|nr:PH domain-containing protein [Opitutaceae bacterium]